MYIVLHTLIHTTDANGFLSRKEEILESIKLFGSIVISRYIEGKEMTKKNPTPSLSKERFVRA